MVYYCAALDCKSNGFDIGTSFHKFPKDNSLKEVWLEKIQRLAMTVSENTVLCSKHFMDSDYVNLKHKRRRLIPEAVPTIFAWAKVIPDKRRLKRDYSRISTGTCHNEMNDSAALHTNGDDDVNSSSTGDNNSFGVARIRHNNELLELYTGFQNYEHFTVVFQYLLPSKMTNCVNVFTLEAEDEANCVEAEPVANTLSPQDQFLMTMMVFRLALPPLDLALRFNISKQNVSKTVITWINYMYGRFSGAAIWPSRWVIIKNASQTFTAKYPCVVAAIAGVYLPVNYSGMTLEKNKMKGCKCVIACDLNGAILFTSQMYEESASYEDIVKQCGLLKLLKMLVETSSLLQGDIFMVDSSFDITADLESLGLKSKVIPLSEQDSDWPVTRSLAAIRRFLFFDGRPIPSQMLDLLDQMWSSVCFLTSLTPLNVTPSSEFTF